MTADSVYEGKFSKFTFALIEDSGWYKVDYSMADDLTWGKDGGCNFVESACQDNSYHKEFCVNYEVKPNWSVSETSCDSHGDMQL